jgi:hypothetical protein
MGIEPTRDLIDPTLVLKTRSATRHQSPPRMPEFIITLIAIIQFPPKSVNVFHFKISN